MPSKLSIKEGWNTNTSSSSTTTNTSAIKIGTAPIKQQVETAVAPSYPKKTSSSSSGSRRTTTSSKSTSSPPTAPATQDTKAVESFAQNLGTQVQSQRAGTYGSTPAVTTKTPTTTKTTISPTKTITPPQTQDTKSVENFAKALGSQTNKIGIRPLSTRKNTIFTKDGNINPYDQVTTGVGSNIQTKKPIQNTSTTHSIRSILDESMQREKTMRTQTMNPLINIIGKQNIQQEKQFRKNIQQYPRGTTFKETKTGFEVQLPDIEKIELEKRKKELSSFYRQNPLGGLAHTWSTGVLSWEDPFGLKTLGYTFEGLFTGKDTRGKILETKARASMDLDKSLKEGYPSYIWKSYTGPLSTVAMSYGAGAAMGVGIGTVKAALPTIGKITEIGVGVGMGAYAIKETTPRVQQIIKTGDIGEATSLIGTLGITGAAGYYGYRTGHTFGYGRTEAYVYRKHTFEPGSPQEIQFKHAIKVARNLESVKSHKIKALDIAKDISRMDQKSAAQVIRYLETHPKTTIGGSAASYTQIEGARVPQDIDLLLPGGKKSVIQAKQFFKYTKTAKGEHLIDIHGKEFFKPGMHHRFGFRSKSPIKIEGTRFYRAGEQLFRKGVSSIQKETSYRHFKDIPDFVTHAQSLIKSTHLSRNPITRFKGSLAQKHLDIYLNPSKGRLTKIGRTAGEYIRKYVKPQNIESVYHPIQKTMYYMYPKSTYPSGITGFTIGTGYTSYTTSKKTTPITISYPKNTKPSFQTITIPKYPINPIKTYQSNKGTRYLPTPDSIYTPSKPQQYPTSTITPAYNPMKYPKGQTIYPKTREYKLPSTTVYIKEKKYPKNLTPSTTNMNMPELYLKRKQEKMIEKMFITPRYRFREFKIPTISDVLKGVKM